VPFHRIYGPIVTIPGQEGMLMIKMIHCILYGLFDGHELKVDCLADFLVVEMNLPVG
jgi:hypothetical protein